MSIESTLKSRANSTCELCGAKDELTVYEIQPSDTLTADTAIIACETCQSQILNPDSMQPDHWRGLTHSMWSEFAPVQVMSYRALSLLKDETWAQELLSQMYLEDNLLELAKKGLPSEDEDLADGKPTMDSNGAQLLEGDAVTLIKDLDVKGANFTAKRGTLVKNIHLTSNPLHVEGKVNGTTIVLVAKFLKKTIA